MCTHVDGVTVKEKDYVRIYKDDKGGMRIRIPKAMAKNYHHLEKVHLEQHSDNSIHITKEENTEVVQ